jgi:predicted metal-binding protein
VKAKTISIRLRIYSHIAKIPNHPSQLEHELHICMACSDLLKENAKQWPSLGPTLVYSTTLITTMMSDRSR